MVLAVAAGILVAMGALVILRNFFKILIAIVVLTAVITSARSEVTTSPMIDGRVIIPQSSNEHQFMGPHYNTPYVDPYVAGMNSYKTNGYPESNTIKRNDGTEVPCRWLTDPDEYRKCVSK